MSGQVSREPGGQICPTRDGHDSSFLVIPLLKASILTSSSQVVVHLSRNLAMRASPTVTNLHEEWSPVNGRGRTYRYISSGLGMRRLSPSIQTSPAWSSLWK